MCPRKQGAEPNNSSRKSWRLWRLLIAWAIAIAVAAVILMVFRQPMVSADESGTEKNVATSAAEITGVATCAPRGPDLYDGLNVESSRQIEQEKEQGADSTISKGCETSRVWVATMTVGGASDASTSYL